MQALTLYIPTVCEFNNHTVHSLYRMKGMATSVVSAMKIESIVSRTGIKPTLLALWASVLTTWTP